MFTLHQATKGFGTDATVIGRVVPSQLSVRNIVFGHGTSHFFQLNCEDRNPEIPRRRV
jgi:hypothetical protein